MSPRRRRIGDLSSRYGRGMVFPEAWERDQEDPEDSVPRRLPPILTCPGCGGRHHILNPCECEEEK